MANPKQYTAAGFNPMIREKTLCLYSKPIIVKKTRITRITDEIVIKIDFII